MSTLHEDLCTFVIIARLFLLRVRNVSDKCCSENENAHFMLIAFFPPENHAFSEAIWKIGVDTDRQARFRERPIYYVSSYIASLFILNPLVYHENATTEHKLLGL